MSRKVQCDVEGCGEVVDAVEGCVTVTAPPGSGYDPIMYVCLDCLSDQVVAGVGSG